MDLIPLNMDLLSLENTEVLKEIYMKKEFTGVNIVSQSLIKLQMIFGKAKAWYGVGNNAIEAIKVRFTKINFFRSQKELRKVKMD